MRPFDTGLAKPQRTLIRDSIVSRLGALLKTANPAGYIPAFGIRALPRSLRGPGDEEGFGALATELQQTAPCIALVLGRLDYEAVSIDATENSGKLEVIVYIVSRNARGVVEGRLFGDAVAGMSSTAEPGIFTMLEHVRELLIGQKLGVTGVGIMRPTFEDELATFADVTIWEQRYELEVDVDINPQRGITKKLLEIETRNKLDGIPDGHAHDPLITTVTTLDPEP